MNDPSREAEPRRLYQVVADQIRASIRDGRFAPLSRLPAERELAQMLGVSRPSLREALIALEVENTIEIRMGSGTYVTAALPPPQQPPASLGESPSEIMQARIVLEGSIAVIACAKLDAAGLRTLRRHHCLMAAAAEAGTVPLEHDRDFHLTVASIAGNSVLRRVVGDLFDARKSVILSLLSAKFESAATWRAAVREHEAILSALQDADPIRAEATMRRHLQCSTDRWLGR